MNTQAIRQHPWRVAIAAVVIAALAGAAVALLRSGLDDVAASTSVGFPLRGDLADDQALLNQAAIEWSRGDGYGRDEQRPVGTITALWAGTVSSAELGGFSVPSAAGASADLVVLSDKEHVATLVRFRDGDEQVPSEDRVGLYEWRVTPTRTTVSLDVGAGLALLADRTTIAAEGVASPIDAEAASWHAVPTELNDGLFQRSGDDEVTLSVTEHGVLLLGERTSDFFQTAQRSGDDAAAEPVWGALSDPGRAAGARAAILDAGATAASLWEELDGQTATWIADVEVTDDVHGTVFAVGASDVDTLVAVSAGLGDGTAEVTAVPLGTHTQGYASPNTAASTPPLTAAWIPVGHGASRLLVVGDAAITSLEVRIGTSVTTVPGHVAVLDEPPTDTWVSTGMPEDTDLPRYVVVGQTVEGWAVPLDR